MSSNCEYYQTLICSMLDGELSDAEENALRGHLQTCGDCRAMRDALCAAADTLRNETVEPPAALKDSVMRRIREEGSGDEASPEHPITQTAHHSRTRTIRRWPKLVAAACLVVVIGSGAVASLHKGANTAEFFAASARSMESVATESAQADTAESFRADAAQEESALEESILESAATGAGEADTADNGVVIYTRDNPTVVPAGHEADFEALLVDAKWGDAGAPAADWSVICAVEYRGVIYEFLSDDEEQYLLWQDAAEGLPVHASGTVSNLWDILQ